MEIQKIESGQKIAQTSRRLFVWQLIGFFVFVAVAATAITVLVLVDVLAVKIISVLSLILAGFLYPIYNWILKLRYMALSVQSAAEFFAGDNRAAVKGGAESAIPAPSAEHVAAVKKRNRKSEILSAVFGLFFLAFLVGMFVFAWIRAADSETVDTGSGQMNASLNDPLVIAALCAFAGSIIIAVVYSIISNARMKKAVKQIRGDIVAKAVVVKCRISSMTSASVISSQTTAVYKVKVVVDGVDDYLTARVDTVDRGTAEGETDFKTTVRVFGFKSPYKAGEEITVAFDRDTKGLCAIVNDKVNRQ
jgi:uncharacterized integral membrane protein